MKQRKPMFYEKNEDFIKGAISLAKDEKYFDFFHRFFNVIPIYKMNKLTIENSLYELVAWSECGQCFSIKLSKEKIKEEFQHYVNASFDVDKILIDRILPEKPYREDLENFHKWLVFVSNLLDGVVLHTECEDARDGISNTDIMVKVLTFSKIAYKREDLESKTDEEKYELALSDKENCRIMDAKEYTDMLNEFRPMEKYVYTYIYASHLMYSNEFEYHRNRYNHNV